MAVTTVEFGHDTSGTTAGRPGNADPGQMYFDTTLAVWLVWSGTAWLTALGGPAGKCNFTATSDPTTTNDTTQGYSAGSFWINTTNSRVWMCLSNTTNAATWLLDGVVPGTGVEPSGMLTQFGAAAFGANFSSFAEEGNLYRNVGNPIAQNGATTSTDYILDGFVLPANSFDQAKRGIQFAFAGTFAATGNNKKIRLWFNPTLAGQTVTNGVISGGTVTGAGSGVLAFDSTNQAGNNVGWQVGAQLFKYGAANSNTQFFVATPIFGTTHGGTSKPTFLTLTENAAINVVLTGSSDTAASDSILQWAEANAMN